MSDRTRVSSPAGRRPSRGRRHRSVEWATALVTSGALLLYLYRHWALFAEPIERLLGGAS